jgi:tetratricopeptide (TPR) repeat protein
MMKRAFLTFLIVIGLLFGENDNASAGDSSKIPALFQASYEAETAGNIDKSINKILQILRIDPNHYVGLYRLGWLYYLKGAYDDSIGTYERAAALRHGSIEAELASMLPLIASKQWKKNEEIAFSILKKCKLNYLARSRLAYAYYLQSRYKEAETQYRQVLKIYPSDTEMALGLAWSLLKEGRVKDARPIFEKVLSIVPSSLNARSGLEACK